MVWDCRRFRQSKTRRQDVKDYHINIFYSEEDGGYIADVPDLQLCSAFGETPAEALAEVERAKNCLARLCKRDGKPVPELRYRPAIYQLVP